jgi:hypothetical protein
MNNIEEDSLLDSLVEPGYFGKTADNIKVFKNFVEPDDLAAIRRFLPTINEWMDSGQDIFSEDGTCLYSASYWANRQLDSPLIKKINPEIHKTIQKYIYKMRDEIESHFKLKVKCRPPVIIRWKTGTEQRPHADKQLNDGRPNPFPTYDINSLIYYNDDFVGGELYYPDFDLEIKPEPGLAVFHPGDINYLHGVKMIQSGDRYTTPSFYTITELGEAASPKY